MHSLRYGVGMWMLLKWVRSGKIEKIRTVLVGLFKDDYTI